jgi:hypothetical protein
MKARVGTSWLALKNFFIGLALMRDTPFSLDTASGTCPTG